MSNIPVGIDNYYFRFSIKAENLEVFNTSFRIIRIFEILFNNYLWRIYPIISPLSSGIKCL